MCIVICAEANLNRERGSLSTKERAYFFSSLLCRGKTRTAVRCVSKREAVGIILPVDVDEKTEDLVKEILISKHPKGRDVTV